MISTSVSWMYFTRTTFKAVLRLRIYIIFPQRSTIKLTSDLYYTDYIPTLNVEREPCSAAPVIEASTEILYFTRG